MSDIKTRYDEDFLAWSKEQAEALRSAGRGGSNQHLDWENLAEEVESLGASQKMALRRQLKRIVEHLLKLEFSPATGPRRGWFETVGDARGEIEDLLATSPSLRAETSAAISSALRQGSRKALRELEKHGELDKGLAARISAAAYTAEQILDEDWFPPEPQD